MAHPGFECAGSKTDADLREGLREAKFPHDDHPPHGRRRVQAAMSPPFASQLAPSPAGAERGFRGGPESVRRISRVRSWRRQQAPRPPLMSWRTPGNQPPNIRTSSFLLRERLNHHRATKPILMLRQSDHSDRPSGRPTRAPTVVHSTEFAQVKPVSTVDETVSGVWSEFLGAQASSPHGRTSPRGAAVGVTTLVLP